MKKKGQNVDQTQEPAQQELPKEDAAPAVVQEPKVDPPAHEPAPLEIEKPATKRAKRATIPPMRTNTPLDTEILQAARDHLQSEVDRLQQKLRDIDVLMGHGRVNRQPRVRTALEEVVNQPKKRVLSPEARARIAAAQKKRWADARKVTKK